MVLVTSTSPTRDLLERFVLTLSGAPMPDDNSIVSSPMKGLSDIYKDLVAGTTAGMASKVIEYPFDTAKVLLQTSPVGEYQGAWDCLRKTTKERGITGLFKGLSSPLVGAMAENAVIFTMYGETCRLLEENFESLNPVWKSAIGGALSGFGVAHVLTPVEFVKCRMQAGDTSRLYRSPFDVVRAMRGTELGVAKSLFQGHLATLIREIPGGFAYFGCYEMAIQVFLGQSQSQDKRDLHPIQIMGAGSCGGIAYWTLTFPIDVVKSKIQVGQGSSSGIFTMLRQIIHHKGIHGMYRGLGITLARSIPSNAIIFLVYESILEYLNT